MKREFDINQKDNNGRSGFFRACMTNALEVVEYLIDQKVDVNQKDKFGNTGIMMAALFGKYQMVEKLF